MRQLLVVVALFFSLSAQAASIDWVPIANPNNTADTLTNCQAANCGSVDHAYYISKYEVTNAQYAEFLNAKAAADSLGLYATSMAGSYGGITRSGNGSSPPSPPSTAGMVSPAMPLPASTTTVSGRTPDRSTKPRR